MISRITRQEVKKRKPGKSGLVGEAKSRSATAIKHDLVLKTQFSALTPFAGGKLTPLGFLRGGSRLYVCIECTLTHDIIIHNSTRVKPGRKIFPVNPAFFYTVFAYDFENFSRPA